MLLSIIITIYNVNVDNIIKLIRKIYDYQIDTQSFEIIIIDDGSKDRKNIEEHFAEEKKKINNLQYIYKDNGGVSSARNLGIEKAKGNFIVFVDGDDDLPSNFVSILISQIKKSNDFDYCYFSYYFGNKKVAASYYSNIEILKDLAELSKHKYEFGFIWGKLFRRKFLSSNKIKFNGKVSWKEDTLFMLSVLIYEPKIAFSESFDYFYKIYEYSLSHNKNKELVYKRSLFLIEYSEYLLILRQKKIFTPTLASVSLYRVIGVLYLKCLFLLSNSRLSEIRREITFINEHFFPLLCGLSKVIKIELFGLRIKDRIRIYLIKHPFLCSLAEKVLKKVKGSERE